jgi:hypothetical protein
MNRITASILITALALGSGAALAQDTYPAHACLTKSDFMSRIGSKYENSDPVSGQTVACPVVRNNLAAGLAVGSTVVVFDQNPLVGAEVSCTLSAKNPDGTLAASSTRSTLGSNPLSQTLSFAALAQVVDGHYTLYCTVPAEWSGLRSSLVSYSIMD